MADTVSTADVRKDTANFGLMEILSIIRRVWCATACHARLPGPPRLPTSRAGPARGPAVLPSGGGKVKITVHIFDSYYQPISERAVLITAESGTLQSRGNPLYSDEQGKVIDYLNTWKTTHITVYAGDVEESIKVIVGG